MAIATRELRLLTSDSKPIPPLRIKVAPVVEEPASECGHHSWDTYQMSQEAVIMKLEDEKVALEKDRLELLIEIEELRARLQLAAETCTPPPRRVSSGSLIRV